MKTKTTKITYWTLTGLFCLFMTMDAIGGLTHNEDGIKALTQLGYPLYLMPLFGIFKLLGVAALLQFRYKTLREWAYAGFTFNFIGASVSWAAVNGPFFFVLLPWIVLAILFAGYYFGKKRQETLSPV